jgi:hypothetical protein
MAADAPCGLVRFCGRDRRAVCICYGLIVDQGKEEREIDRLDGLPVADRPKQTLEEIRGHVSRELVNQLVQPVEIIPHGGHTRLPRPLGRLPERPHPLLREACERPSVLRGIDLEPA